MTETTTRKPGGVDVTTTWDGTTPVKVAIPQDDHEWSLEIVVNGVSTMVDFAGPMPKK